MTARPEIPENLQHRLKMHNIRPETLALVPQAMARKYHIIPLEANDGVLRLAMTDSTDIVVIDMLGAQIPMYIRPEAVSAEEIEEAIDFNYEASEEDSDYEAHKEIERQVSKIRSLSITGEEQIIVTEETDSPIIRTLSLILNDAVRTGASDIHFQPQ